MKIVYHYSREDFVAFHSVVSEKQLKSVKNFRIFILVLLILSSAIFVFSKIVSNETDLLVPIILLGFVLYSISPKRMKSKTNKRFAKMIESKENDSLFGDCILELKEDYIEQKLELISYKTYWKAIVKYKETEEYYFIYSSGLSAFIIPKKELTDCKSSDLELLLMEKIK